MSAGPKKLENSSLDKLGEFRYFDYSMTNDEKKLKPSAAVFTLIAIIGRLVPHLPNMTPLGASAIFGGKKLSRPWNYLLPLTILFFTDMILGFHDSMIYVYLSFGLIVFLSEKVRNDSVLGLGSTAVAASLIFFVVTNFGVWLNGWYPHTLAGLIDSFVMGLPFLRNMLIGDVLYTGIFFGAYKLVTNLKVTQKFDNKILGWIN